MNATTAQERAAVDAAILELLFANEPYIDWRGSDDIILGAVWIDKERPDYVIASKRFGGKEVKRDFQQYADALKWALDRSHA